jgi:hypothetical protein
MNLWELWHNEASRNTAHGTAQLTYMGRITQDINSNVHLCISLSDWSDSEMHVMYCTVQFKCSTEKIYDPFTVFREILLTVAENRPFLALSCQALAQMYAQDKLAYIS